MTAATATVALVCGLAGAIGGCDSDSAGAADDGDTGSVRIALTMVPADVRCVVIAAMGASRGKQQSFDVTPGQSSILGMNGLPIGVVTFSGQAYGVGCGAVTSMTPPTFVADPVAAQIVAGAVANVTLTMRRSGTAIISIDFDDGTGGAGTGGAGTGGAGTGGAATGGAGTGGAGTGGAATGGAGTGGAATGGDAGETGGAGGAITLQIVGPGGPGATPLLVTEGGSGVITLVLSAPPAMPVPVILVPSDPTAAAVSPPVVTFAPGDAGPLSFTVLAVEDVNVVNETVSIRLRTPTLGPPDADLFAAVQTLDDDVQAIQLLDPASLAPLPNLTFDEGTPRPVCVRLAFQPQAITPVDLTVAPAGFAVTPPVVAFGPGDFATCQLVQLAFDDNELVDKPGQLVATGLGLAPQTVALLAHNTDVQEIVVSATTLTVLEGTSAPLRVNLRFKPPSNQVVNVALVPPGKAVALPSPLGFTPTDFATPKNLLVAGRPDADMLDEALTLTLSSPLGPTPTASVSIAVTVIDDDHP